MTSDLSKSIMATKAEGDDPERCPRICLYVFNIFFWILGLGCLCIGLWFSADPNVRHWLVVLRRNPSDETLTAGGIVFIVIGFIMCFMGFMSCCGAMRKNRMLLKLFCIGMFFIMVTQLTIGFCVVAFRHELHRYVKDGMKTQIRERYEFDNREGYAWNWVQVRLRCCGADGSWDYRRSNWWYSENPGVDDENMASVFVPKTCCKLDFNQDRDVTRVNPQDPKPKDERRCQEDAAGMKDGSDYLNGRGCYAALLDFIYTHIHLVLGLGLTVGFMQIFGFVSACVLMRHLGKDDDY